MAAGGRGIEVAFDEAALREFLTNDPDVTRTVERASEIVAQGAKRRSPVSADGSNGRPSGYLRSRIGWLIRKDAQSMVGVVATPATTPTGEPYGLFQEVGTSKMAAQPHLRPALDDIRGVQL